MPAPTPKNLVASLTFLLALVLAACGPGPGPASTPTPAPSPTLTSTPTVTPIPLAASVNGVGITAAEFEAELARYQHALTDLGNSVSLETATQAVLNDMIDTMLLEQGAVASGFTVDDALVQSRMDVLASQVGGLDALLTWESAHGYTEADFRSALRRQVAAAWMRDQIVAAVPEAAEQVHVKQILLYDASVAQQALDLLHSGWNFEDLAAQYDPLTGGELGWFPRGYLPAPDIEQAAFALQPGQFSAIIQDETGYHILYVAERDPARLLSPDALLTLQGSAVQSWLTQRRNESVITR